MSRKISLELVIGTLIFIFASCVEEYKIPKEMTQAYESRLVIQGRILSGDESVVYLNNTVPFGQVERPEPILNAEITIVGQNGYESDKAVFDIENDRYVIPSYDLPSNTLYALKVELDGETYQSEYQPLLSPKTIDELYYKENPDGISLFVSSSGNEDDTPYYIWNYEEDWEFHADVDLSAPTLYHWMYNEAYYPGIVEGKSNPYYYCWNHDISSLIYIYDAGPLSQNVAKDFKILDIPVKDIRISYIYSILVKQGSLSKEAYEYFRKQKLYTEQAGGLFTPIPGEITSNVKCITDPQKKVYGYVVVSNVTTQRLFVYASDFEQIGSEHKNCHPGYGHEQEDYYGVEAWKMWWFEEVKDKDVRSVILNEKEGYGKEYIEKNSILYYKECVDCRTYHGATKKRPDFWPTDHE